eukprot:GHVN01071118.1.p1 GENE.GHVN01071118.1~~GHVN01071118.1.p1  ORF type:complete len:110 (-),score=9.06 GHVN01071118.1:92-421(-)
MFVVLCIFIQQSWLFFELPSETLPVVSHSASPNLLVSTRQETSPHLPALTSPSKHPCLGEACEVTIHCQDEHFLLAICEGTLDAIVFVLLTSHQYTKVNVLIQPKFKSS